MDTRDDEEKTKLQVACGEIEAILRKHDLCAHVAIVGRGRLNLMCHLDASWSNLSLIEDEECVYGIRLRSKTADYQGDEERQLKDVSDTVGMVRALAETLSKAALAWIKVSEHVSEATGVKHEPLKPEPKH